MKRAMATKRAVPYRLCPACRRVGVPHCKKKKCEFYECGTCGIVFNRRWFRRAA